MPREFCARTAGGPSTAALLSSGPVPQPLRPVHSFSMHAPGAVHARAPIRPRLRRPRPPRHPSSMFSLPSNAGRVVALVWRCSARCAFSASSQYAALKFPPGELCGVFRALPFVRCRRSWLALPARIFSACAGGGPTLFPLTITYAPEVCPVALRGYLTTYVSVCWGLGQWAYPIPYALQWMWPVPPLIGISLTLESPWWLVRRGRIPEARKALLRLTSKGKKETGFDMDEMLAMMRPTTMIEERITRGATYWDCFRGTDLRRTERSPPALVSYSLSYLVFSPIPPHRPFILLIYWLATFANELKMARAFIPLLPTRCDGCDYDHLHPSPTSPPYQ
ncbi:hypothetical protein FB451DRAFT_1387516 [Mycena latifolia]|nr:hypothetical protein FB451DRAFT_1387516 [Mycena latifolia]